MSERREQPEIDVHRLIRAWARIDRFDMASSNVTDERAVGGCWRRQKRPLAQPLRGGEATGKKTDRRRLDVAFAAGDLSGKA